MDVLVNQNQAPAQSEGSFVGRQDEMDKLRSAFDDVFADRARVLMLIGEPGIGKTRMVQELVAAPEWTRVEVVWGRCYENQGAPPYWPWIQAIRSYIIGLDADRLRLELGSGAAPIAEIVSDIRDRLPDLEPPAPLENQKQAWFRLCDSITRFLKSASRAQPIVLVLEDLHWADQASLQLLEFVTEELSISWGSGESRLLVVATSRDVPMTHPMRQTLGQLTRERAFQRLPLEGLSSDEVGRYIEATTGVLPARSLVEAIYSRTGGNPLFMTEVVRLLAGEGELTEDSARNVGIPDAVHEAIARRLSHLSEQCKQALVTASVIGEEFSLDQLAPLVDDLTHDRLVDELDEAMAVRAIEEVPALVGHYRFTHSLIQEALVSELSSARRGRLHGRIGGVLEELYGDRAEHHASELAHHFAEALGTAAAAKAVHYSLLAGERALGTYAYEEALSYFQGALGLLEQGRGSQDTAAALKFGLGRASVATLRVQQAKIALSDAFDYYFDTGDASKAVAVAEYFPLLPGVAGVSQLLERGLAMVPSESLEAGRLLSGYGLSLDYETGDHERAYEALQRALTIARRDANAALEVRTLANLSTVEALHQRWESSLEASHGVFGLKGEADDPHADAQARYWAAHSLIAKGDLEGASYQASEMLATAEKFRDHFWISGACSVNQTLSRLRGDWEAARDFCDRGLGRWPQDPDLLSTRAILEYELGDSARGEQYLSRLLDIARPAGPGLTWEYASHALVIPMIALITGGDERFDEVKRSADAVLSPHYGTPYHTILARAGLGLMAIAESNVKEAEEQYAALQQSRGSKMIGGVLCVDRLLGLLAETMGLLDDACAHFDDAAKFSRAAGYRPELGWVCCSYAQAMLERAGPGDRESAMSLLDEANEIAQSLGMRPLMDRTLSVRERAEAQLPTAPSYPDGLTPREAEVLCLLAGGKASREIADELFISVYTVNRHIDHIYTKIGHNNRAEATAYAIRNNIESILQGDMSSN